MEVAANGGRYAKFATENLIAAASGIESVRRLSVT